MAKKALPDAVTEAAATPHEMVSETIYQDPKFWVATAFVIFLVVAAKYVWPAIARTLDKRAEGIREQLEQAARLKTEAETLLAEYKRQQEQTLRDAEEILANAQRDAELIRTNAAEDLKITLARRTAQAEESIQRAEAQAMAQLRAHLVEVATEATRSMVVEQLKGTKEDPAIARALQAIEHNMH